ncbi:MAG: YkgJ family cysteine cluster protein [Phycisphaerales bacterium]|nr:MAG: YkgJ family cysteine cluster protein [Phycisphaerales bacterium]
MDADEVRKPEDAGAAASEPQECLHCGACCSNPGRPPFRPEEMADLPAEIQHLVASLDARDPERATYATLCYFFNVATRKCLIYEHRPQACRDFKPGGQVCQELRRAFASCLDRFNDDMRSRH